MANLKQLEEEINKIKERNRRVETEKAWETSKTRTVMIAVMTYFVVAIFFNFLGTSDPFGDAIVPSLAFILSTIGSPIIKKWWLKKYIHKES